MESDNTTLLLYLILKLLQGESRSSTLDVSQIKGSNLIPWGQTSEVICREDIAVFGQFCTKVIT